jgi:hypothetical protein
MGYLWLLIINVYLSGMNISNENKNYDQQNTQIKLKIE